MKILSRILTICLCSAPFVGTECYGVVASTSGHNLTAYNPSNTTNNQWATLTNVRDKSDQPTARVDFGNCNAVIMRCATPKCANGGCVDANVAAAIVAGCVQSNPSCSQYGDDLISYMSAQLVVNSTAKINAQTAASEAAAAAAQAAASQQTAQQIAQMQQEMQMQMAQIQQQMAAQNAETQQQLQDAIAAQQEQNAAALQNITASAATVVSPVVTTQPTVAQESAIERGISSEILVRQQITGQIMTEIENAEVSLKATKTAMQNSFEYAGCDARGNNCSGPKRVKKWRELATEFLEPYDNTIDKIYDALITAQTVGVPLDDIYMMLNDSCNAWGQYMCPPGRVTYTSNSEKGEKGAPMVCKDDTYDKCLEKHSGCLKTDIVTNNGLGLNTSRFSTSTDYECVERCKQEAANTCQYCTLLKVLTDKADVYEGWISPDPESTSNQTVVACASTILDSSKLFQRRTKSKNGAGLVDIDALDNWLHQTEPSVSGDADENMKYCVSDDMENDKKILQSSMSSRSVPAKNTKFCVNDLVANKPNNDLEANTDCPYIAGTYAICDTHPYNAGKPSVDRIGTVSPSGTANISESEQIREMVALKVTVISQQMYKQYEYLNATLRRLKTQLEKTVLTSTLEAAGAKSDSESSSSSGGGWLGSRSSDDKEIVLAGAENCWNASSPESAYSCIQNNLNVVKSNASTNKQKAAKQLGKTAEVARQWGICTASSNDNNKSNGNKAGNECDDACKGYTSDGGSSDSKKITKCANALSVAVARQIADDKKESNRYYGYGDRR